MSEENKCCVKKDNLAAKENAAVAKEREDRIRMVRERQNEERQRKLEELKAQALAAQRFREQKEEERRRRLEESRSRDFDRRHQVEERKKAIQDAERERREYLLRKNQEREARFESKRRNERSSIVFAFGSSTPRLLDPGEMGTVSPSQFWNHRRATSISNIAYSGAPLTRRSSERELNEAPKKRATSATALDRQREGLRSGEVTPGGTLSSRPNSAMSNSTVVSSTVSRRSTMTPRKPRPASIAVTGVSLPNGNNADGHKGSVKQEKPPLPKVTAQMKKSAAISSSLMTRSLDLSGKKSLERTPLKSRGSSKTATPLMSPGTEKEIKMPSEKPTQSQTPKIEKPVKQVVNKEEVHDVAKQEEVVKEELKKEVQKKEDVKEEEPKNEVKEEPLVITEEVDNKEVVVKQEVTENGVKEEQITTVTAEIENDVEQSNEQEDPSDVMSTSMMSKSRITTEEEAKAALAERRRLARVEAERQAEAERLRLIAEAEAEQKRIAEEEEKQRQLEQEALRLAEEQRKAEEERLARAIEEARKREEEEKLQREAEARQKAEREEQEKKAREEAEKLRLQTAERLKKEEIEREERRKRVEAIMLRTRTKGSVSGTPTKGSGDEKASNDAKEDTSNSGSGQEQTKQETESSHNQTKNIPSINNQPDTVTEKAQMEQQQMSYEKSVTEKENSLLGSFTHIVDGINNKSNHIHGQSVIGDGHQENVLIPDVINNKVLNNSTENGFKNSGVDNILSSVDCTNNVVDSKVLAMNQDNAKQPDQQLIDFDSLPQQQQIEDVFNYNNNNDRANTTSAIPSLVTADSQENRDISLF
ncbi:ensconsin isoform X9 [Lutzomyia longipalpis]|uniref:ensconsin isoform X9 n=1 Tax=Lutzomyia longipalpis TaxID=7200 RepID=UPI0024844B81|nr:ensconsin isoform X9 [Lutzomyia longipalpis]